MIALNLQFADASGEFSFPPLGPVLAGVNIIIFVINTESATCPIAIRGPGRGRH